MSTDPSQVMAGDAKDRPGETAMPIDPPGEAAMPSLDVRCAPPSLEVHLLAGFTILLALLEFGVAIYFAAIFNEVIRFPFHAAGDMGGNTLDIIRRLALAQAVARFIFSPLLLLAGLGLLKRRPWSRTMLLILAGIMLLSIIVNAAQHQGAGELAIQLLYVAAVFLLLLPPAYAAEFGRPGLRLAWLRSRTGGGQPMPVRTAWLIGLGIGCAVATSLALVFAVLYFTNVYWTSGDRLVQQGVVKGTVFRGVVKYPIPYAEDPKVQFYSLGRLNYRAEKSNKFGFSWVAHGQVDQPFEHEFNWEAVGVRSPSAGP